VVLGHSGKSQVAIALGLISFVGILLMGQVLVGGLALHGHLATLTDVVREELMSRYDKAAWLALGGFAALGLKTYRRDRRRLLGI
jgi:hypothetical protein